MESQPQAPTLPQKVIDLAKYALDNRPTALIERVRIPLEDTDLFVADSQDKSIRVLGFVVHGGVTYVVGPLIDSQEK